MIYLLHGEETYLTRRKFDEINKAYFGKHKGLNFFEFDFSPNAGPEKSNFESLKDIWVNRSLFLDKKLLAVKNLFEDKVSWEKFIDFSEENNLTADRDNIAIVYEEKKIADKDLTRIKKIAKIQEFKKLDKRALAAFIKKETEVLGAAIDKAASDKLISLSGDLYRLKNELAKLAAYDKKINLKSVELLTVSEADLSIFEMTDSLAIGNKKQAIRIFEELLRQGESEGYLFSMVAYIVRSLLTVKSIGEGNKQARGFSPFVFFKLRQASNKFSLDDLKAKHRELFKIEIALKSGQGEFQPLLTKFFLEF